MTAMFAAKSDITMLTGKRTREEQSAELAKKGITFDLNSRGDILVLRSTIEQVVFLIKIPDPEGLLEEAFDRVIDDVRTATGLPTLKGNFEGPSHKR